MPWTLRHLFLLLVSTIFTSTAFSSAINLPASHQALSDSSDSSETTTTGLSTALTFPLANTKGIIPTPPVLPTIFSHPPGPDLSYESTDIHLDSPTQTFNSKPNSEPISFQPISFQPSSFQPTSEPTSEPSSFQPSSFQSLPSLQSLRPCTTTLTTTLTSTSTTNNINNRPCPPPTWDGTLTSYPSTTTLLNRIDCHGCMYVSVTKEWAVGCPNLHVSATLVVTTASTTWREVCEGVVDVPLVTGTAARS